MKIFGIDITRNKLAAAPIDPALDVISQIRNQLFAGITTDSTAIIDDNSVLSLSAVFACMGVLAEDIALAPLVTYQRGKGNARYKAFNHPLYKILHSEPNPEMTSMAFKEMMCYQMLLPSGGAAYAEIEHDEQGNVKYLWPLLSKDVETLRDDTKQIFYRVHLPDGGNVDLPSYKVLCILGRTSNGYTSNAAAKSAGNVIGLSLALEKFASLHFATGGFVKDYLKTPNKLGPEARTTLKDSWQSGHGVLSMSQRTAILDNGLEYVSVMAELAKIMPPELRTQQVLEVARLYRMPPYKIGEYGRATWANTEQQGIEYLAALLPWFTRWEQECNRKLLLTTEKSYMFTEYMGDIFLRADFESRMRGYAIAMQNGLATRNECRAKENQEPVDGGDEIFVPMNMAPLSKIISGEISPSGKDSQSTKGGTNDKDTIK